MEIEVGCYARAILDFDTNVAGELPLTIGDVVRVDKQIDKNWLHGSKFGGFQGIFPTSFVTKLKIPKLHNQQKLFIAIDTFPAQQAGDLGFTKGDAIVGIKKIDDNWMEGEVDGNRGIFPSNFAKEVPPPKLHYATNTNGHSMPLTALNVNSSNSGTIKAIVKTNLDAKLPEEIALKAGETVYIDEYIDKNWCRGRTPDGRKGIFPKGFVEIVTPSQSYDSQPQIFSSPQTFSPSVRSASPIIPSSTKLPSPVANYTSVVTNTTSASPTVTRAKISEPQIKDEIQPYGRTKYSFSAEYPEELSFSPNQIVKLVKHIDEEWTLGELNGRKGIFPTSYVDIIADCSTKSFENKSVGARNEREHEQFIVVCDFDGTVHGDLQARMNDRIGLIKRINEDWIEGYNHRTNSKGLIPLNFLKEVVSDKVQVTFRNTDGRKGYGQERPHSLDEAISENIMRLDNGDRPLTPNFSNAQIKSSRQSAGVTYAQHSEPRQGSFEPKKDSSQFSNRLYPTINEIKHSPPARPTASPALKKPIQEDLEQQRRQQEDQKKLEVRTQRTRIFQEIITSERDYCNDLTLCQDTFSIHRNALDIDVLLAGLPAIVLLSKKLLHALEAEFAKDFVYQEVGTPFLTLQEEFKSVYGGFCETHEDVQIMLDKYETEPPKQIVLKDCLQKIQQQTNCMDLSSLLSRPIQRVLKYPLFISEVLKCTEGNQSDKVKLMMALKVMTEVAQCINETKRRKEMVSKYRKDGDTNFSERLSRLNMHTFRKKSSRFSVRLSSSIGLTQTIKDEDFDKSEREFRSVEKACRTFVRDVQAYCEQMLMFFNQQMSIAESLHHGVGAKSQKTEAYFEAWSRILFSEATLQKFFDSVSEKVRTPVSVVQQTCKGPEKLIVKRRDKMLDLEAASSRYEKEKSRGESAEPSRLRTLEEEYRKAKVEYEAMNNQLKNELPQLCNIAYDVLTMATKAFVAAQRSWVYDLGRQLQPLERLIDNSVVGIDAIFDQFQKKNQFVSTELTRLTFATSSPSGAAIVSGRSPTISKKSSITIEPITPVNKSNHIVFPQKPQNEADRQIMRTKYDDKKLYVTTCAYHAQSDMDISLKPGDLVGVIVNKDPMGNSDRWFIDNGVGKGFVPCNILQKYEDRNGDVANNQLQKAVNVSQIVKERPKLISPEPKPNPAVDRFGGSVKKPPISAKPLNRPIMSRSHTEIGNGIASSVTTKEPVRPKLVPERAAPSPHTTLPLQPIRSAPPPPASQQRHKSTITSSSSSTTPDDEYKSIEKHSQNFVNDQENVEFCLVKYDFSARTENELSLIEGHLVAVHAKQDLENNSDWWLVETDDGEIGYVPANYLSAYKD